MCLYHEENKTAKQTDIGGKDSAMTVELLRNVLRLIYAEQHYLALREGNPIKFPDIPTMSIPDFYFLVAPSPKCCARKRNI